MSVEVFGAGAGGRSAPAGRMTVHIEAGAAQLSGLRQVTRTYLRQRGVDGHAAADVVLAVHEAAVNAVRHGEGPVEVQIVVADGEIATTVSDEGPGIDPRMLSRACPGLEEHGRGLYLMRRLMDDVAVVEGPHAVLRMVRAV